MTTETHRNYVPPVWGDALDPFINAGSVPGLVALYHIRGETHVYTAGVQDLESKAPIVQDSIFRIASLTKPIAAAAAMILVEAGKLSLDDPVDNLLPELANRQVLTRIDGPLTETVPAQRSITLRDLLTMRMGLGYIMRRSQGFPIQEAINKLGILQGMPKLQTWPDPDTRMAGIGTLPLMAQPGEQWMYDLSSTVLGVLIARAADQSLDEFLREKIFTPLGMDDTGFYVPEAQQSRLVTAYASDPKSDSLHVYDHVGDSQWTTMPPFQSADAGLVSTVTDYLAFCQMLLNKGTYAGERLLSAHSVAMMTTDQLTAQQRASNRIFLGENSGWGFGMAVNIANGPVGERPGRFGWVGGLGTTAYTDPTHGVVGILFTQRMMDSPEPPGIFNAFWTEVYRAVERT